MDELDKKIVDILRRINDSISINVNENLLEKGYIDSFDIVNIVSELEKIFDIEIDPEDIVPENFYSIHCISALILKTLNE